jgi:hypothetical protein
VDLGLGVRSRAMVQAAGLLVDSVAVAGPSHGLIWAGSRLVKVGGVDIRPLSNREAMAVLRTAVQQRNSVIAITITVAREERGARGIDRQPLPDRAPSHVRTVDAARTDHVVAEQAAQSGDGAAVESGPSQQHQHQQWKLGSGADVARGAPAAPLQGAVLPRGIQTGAAGPSGAEALAAGVDAAALDETALLGLAAGAGRPDFPAAASSPAERPTADVGAAQVTVAHRSSRKRKLRTAPHNTSARAVSGEGAGASAGVGGRTLSFTSMVAKARRKNLMMSAVCHPGGLVNTGAAAVQRHQPPRYPSRGLALMRQSVHADELSVIQRSGSGHGHGHGRTPSPSPICVRVAVWLAPLPFFPTVCNRSSQPSATVLPNRLQPFFPTVCNRKHGTTR